MSEVENHIEGLKQLVEEHRLLSLQNRELTRENILLKQQIEAIRPYAQGILALCCDLQVKEEKKELHAIFRQEIEKLDFSIRVYNCLKYLGTQTVGEIVQKTETQILQSRNFGRKGLYELKEVLSTQGLRLGMNEEDMLAWIPPDPTIPPFGDN